MRPIRKLFKFIAIVLLVLLLPAIWLKAQAIEDFAKLIHYTAPTQVANIAAQDSMTSYAKHIFYINHPTIETDVASFRSACTESEQTIVLGCYHSGQSGIGIYAVSDNRLEGILQVTAAHEMLHGAYERLSAKDKSYINFQLEQFFATITDQRLIDTINSYKKTEPNDIDNEMHSIFGTEVSVLPSALENYYKKYFDNRSVVVGYAQKYQAEFTGRQNQINAYDARLNDLKNKINTRESSLGEQSKQISNDRNRLDQLRSTKQLEAYNSLVVAFNAEVDSYNNGVALLKQDIASYNSIVVQRNSVADQINSLDAAIDTRLTTQTGQ